MAECVHGLTTGCTYGSDVRPAGAPATVYVTFGGNKFHAQPDCPYLLQGQESAADRDDRVHAVRGLGWIEATASRQPCRHCVRMHAPAPRHLHPSRAATQEFADPRSARRCSVCGNDIRPLEPVGVDRDRDGLRTYRHVSCPG